MLLATALIQKLIVAAENFLMALVDFLQHLIPQGLGYDMMILDP